MMNISVTPLVEAALAIYRIRPSESKLIWVEGLIDAAVLYGSVPPEQGDAWEQELAGGPGFHPYWSWREVHRRRKGTGVWRDAPPPLVETADPDQDMRDAVAYLEAAPDRIRMLLAQNLLASGVKGSGLPAGTADRWEAELKSYPALFDPRLAWRQQIRMRPAVNVRRYD